jgi:branched-chain amino acid aminotransferase
MIKLYTLQQQQKQQLLCFFFLLISITFSTASSSSSPPSLHNIHPQHPEPEPNIDWDTFGFGLNNVRTNFMWLNQIHRLSGNDFENYSTSSQKCILPLAPLSLHPSCTVLNYGQSLFEGLKAFRRPDNTIALFRPDQNALQMYNGAECLLLPPVPVSTFIKAADAVTRNNTNWIPPHGSSALYLCLLLFGSGDGLGVKASNEAIFCIYCSPVGNYFKGGLKAIKLQAVKGYSRAAPGGSGSVKAGGNYAPAFLVQKKVWERGYDEALFLDVVRYVKQKPKKKQSMLLQQTLALKKHSHTYILMKVSF